MTSFQKTGLEIQVRPGPIQEFVRLARLAYRNSIFEQTVRCGNGTLPR